jgi:hypothetical protein
MGTRGLFGFYYQGKFYVIYNHFDSYPSGLGAAIVEELRRAIQESSDPKNRLSKWIQQLEQLRLVSPRVPPTLEDIQKLRPYTDVNVSQQSTTDWYCLLRHCQGSVEKVLASGYLDNCVDTSGLPLWEEYAYIINLDTQKLDFYEENRLVNSFDFDNLPSW